MKQWFTLCLMSMAVALTACQNTTAPATNNTNTAMTNNHTQVNDLKNNPEYGRANAVFDQALAAYNVQDYAKALPLFRQASAQGVFKADRYIGLMYLNGYGVAKNPNQAFVAFTKAAEQDITGQYWLGYCYENAIGTKINMKQAIYWYKKSAQRGDHVSQPAIDALTRLGIEP